MVGLLHCNADTRGRQAIGSNQLHSYDRASGDQESGKEPDPEPESDIPHQIRGNLINCTHVLPIVSICCTLSFCSLHELSFNNRVPPSIAVQPVLHLSFKRFELKALLSLRRLRWIPIIYLN